MTFGRFVAAVLLLASALLDAAPARADIRLIARESFNGRQTTTTVHWFGDKRSARDDGRQRTVMRYDLGRMYVIDRKARNYRSLALPNSPPLPVFVVPTDDTARIGPWLARRWRVDGPAAHGRQISLWTTRDIERSQAFVELMQKLAAQPGAEWLAAYARIEGFPVLQEITLSENGMTQTRRSEVVSYRVMTAPDETYLPPRGYKRVP